MTYVRDPASSARSQYRTEACAVLAILLMVLSYMSNTTGIGYDGRQYLTYAQNLLATGQFTYNGHDPSCGRAPGYPVFLASVIALFGNTALVYPLQLAFLFTAFCLVINVFDSICPDLNSSILLLLFAALSPLHRIAMDMQTESLFLFLTAIALLLLVKGLSSPRVYSVLGAGIAFAASSYVRPVNLLAPVAFGALIVAWKPQFWRRGVLMALVGILCVLPWAVRNYRTFGKIVPMAAHYGSVYYMTDASAFWPVLTRSAGHSHTLPVYGEIVGDRLELDWEANERYARYAQDNIKKDPLGFVGRCLVKTIFVWGYLPGTKVWLYSNPFLFSIGSAIQITFLSVSFLGLLRIKGRDAVAFGVLMAYVAYTILALFPFYSESRFLLPIYIWLFGAAWCWLAGFIRPATVRLG